MMQKDFRDIRYSAIAEIETGGLCVSFKVYSIYGESVSGKLLWCKNVGNCTEYTSDIADASVWMHGGVKWDGCSNWHIDEQDRAMLHECDREGLVAIGEVMARCWDWAAELMPDKLIAEAK